MLSKENKRITRHPLRKAQVSHKDLRMNNSSQDPRANHAQALKSRADRSTFNNLITLYSKSNLLSYASRVFSLHIPNPNVVSWTSLISAHAGSDLSFTAFISMLRHPTIPNQRTLASLLKTCTALSSFAFGTLLHALSVKLSISSEPFTGSALVNFYCKLRLPWEARKAFDEMPERDEVCYASIIVGLAQNSRPAEALSCFVEMTECEVGSTMYSISGAVRAAAELAALEQCKMLHCHAVATGLDSDVVVGTSLIDAYGKCGLVSDARRLFDESLFRDMNVVGWNAMMAGYAQQGDYKAVLELFGRMEARGLIPDEYSFLAVGVSLSNARLTSETEQWLDKMRMEYGLEPQIEHYTCLVTALGGAGRLEDAERIAVTLPFKPDAAMWRTLLSACASHGNADLALTTGKRLLELNALDDSAYVILSNALSTEGRWDEVAEVRKLMKDRMVKKQGGRSWIELQGKEYVFWAGDRNHPPEVYAKLDELMEKIAELGYVPVYSEMLHEVEEREKREALLYHSEKLAVAFAMVNGAAIPGKALRILKNLRICRDCHEAFKYMSCVLESEIIVRDVNRYHRFLNGACTCGDYW